MTDEELRLPASKRDAAAMTVTIATKTATRRCGECTLCCKLLPMRANAYPRAQVAETLAKMLQAGMVTQAELKDGMLADFDKAAGARCPHQRFGHGCGIYSRRPFGCRFWNCAWLANHNDEAGDLRRPDRAGYVIDVMPDFVVVDPGDGGKPTNVEVIQIWIDPKRPDAWRKDEALLALLEARGREGKFALIRFNESKAITRVPGTMCSDGKPHEIAGSAERPTRSGAERFEGLAQCQKIKLEIHAGAGEKESAE